ncbi:uncharacterized protein LOC144914950 [Branchiostoma floridae x Branchiostoma belcheri]
MEDPHPPTDQKSNKSSTQIDLFLLKYLMEREYAYLRYKKGEVERNVRGLRRVIRLLKKEEAGARRPGASTTICGSTSRFRSQTPGATQWRRLCHPGGRIPGSTSWSASTDCGNVLAPSSP